MLTNHSRALETMAEFGTTVRIEADIVPLR